MIDAAEVLVDEVGDIGTRTGAEQTEEIVGGDDLAAPLTKVGLNKCVEGFVADALADFFKEVGALKISGVGVSAEALSFVDGNIYKAFGVVKVYAVGPPP